MKVKTLREWRQQEHLTQDELAAASGVSQDTISDLETGRHPNPTINTLSKLTEALGIQPAQVRFPRPISEKRHGRRPVGVGL